MSYGQTPQPAPTPQSAFNVGQAPVTHSPLIASGPVNTLTAWLVDQSSSTVILALGLIGVYFIGKSHIGDLKEAQSTAVTVLNKRLDEERAESKTERQEFREVLKACCPDRRTSLNHKDGAFSASP